MFYSCYQVINCVMPASGVQGIRIRDKWLCSGCPDLFYNLPDKNRVDISIVSIFSKVDFYCSQVFCSQKLNKTCLIKEFLNFADSIFLRVFRSEICKINFTCTYR